MRLAPLTAVLLMVLPAAARAAPVSRAEVARAFRALEEEIARLDPVRDGARMADGERLLTQQAAARAFSESEAPAYEALIEARERAAGRGWSAFRRFVATHRLTAERVLLAPGEPAMLALEPLYGIPEQPIAAWRYRLVLGGRDGGAPPRVREAPVPEGAPAAGDPLLIPCDLNGFAPGPIEVTLRLGADGPDGRRVVVTLAETLWVLPDVPARLAAARRRLRALAPPPFVLDPGERRTLERRLDLFEELLAAPERRRVPEDYELLLADLEARIDAAARGARGGGETTLAEERFVTGFERVAVPAPGAAAEDEIVYRVLLPAPAEPSVRPEPFGRLRAGSVEGRTGRGVRAPTQSPAPTDPPAPRQEPPPLAGAPSEPPPLAGAPSEPPPPLGGRAGVGGESDGRGVRAPTQSPAPTGATTAPARRLPVVVALHGMGFDQDAFFWAYGRGAFARLCRARGWMAVAPAARRAFQAGEVEAVLADLKARYPVDEDRIALLGHSMGAYAAAQLAAAAPGRFRALALFGGGAVLAGQAALLARTPLWIGFGSEDERLPLFLARQTVRGVQAAGGAAQFHAIAGYGHTHAVGAALDEAFVFLDRCLGAGR